jgi:hypothetical protein
MLCWYCVSISGICRLKVPARQNDEKTVKKGRKLKVTIKSTNYMRNSTLGMTAIMTHDRQTFTPYDTRHGVRLKSSSHFQKKLPPLPTFSPPLGT